jgi:formate hydrogenlyase transcriptional activator
MKFNDAENEKIQRLSQATIEQATMGIFWVDSQGAILKANQSASRILGWSNEEFLELTISGLDEQFPLDLYEDYWNYVRNTGEVTFESSGRCKDGAVLPVEVTSYFVDFGKSGYTCTFFRDITERKRIETQLHQALDELEKVKNRLQDEHIYLQEEIRIGHNFNNIIGKSPSFKKLLGQVEQVAASDATVLIFGETGTGKELIARAVHDFSSRKERPLVKINCAALPATLIESELFGHEKGAFTGALARKIGRFELADCGTIFLDEIGDLSLELQGKLLRVLQEGEFERVGNPATMTVDVRVIAATNRNLKKQLKKGYFREDLFYRLNVFPMHLPPLRERQEDIPLFIRYFVDKYSVKAGKKITAVSQKALKALQTYRWPGNVRELENIIERAIVITRGNRLELGDWFVEEKSSSDTPKVVTLEENERQLICQVLERTGWKVSGEKGAAKLLDINPKTLESRIKKLGIHRE